MWPDKTDQRALGLYSLLRVPAPSERSNTAVYKSCGTPTLFLLRSGRWLGSDWAQPHLSLIALIAGLVLRLERQYFVNLQHTYVFAASALDVLANTEFAEAREHGYLLTGDPSYIEPYQGSRKDLDEEFDRLRDLVKNNPKEQEKVEKLRYLVHQKLDELQAAIDVRATAGPEATRTLVRTGRSPQLMDAIRKHVSGMQGKSRARWHDSRGSGGRDCGSAWRLSLGASS